MEAGLKIIIEDLAPTAFFANSSGAKYMTHMPVPKVLMKKAELLSLVETLSKGQATQLGLGTTHLDDQNLLSARGADALYLLRASNWELKSSHKKG